MEKDCNIIYVKCLFNLDMKGPTSWLLKKGIKLIVIFSMYFGNEYSILFFQILWLGEESKVNNGDSLQTASSWYTTQAMSGNVVTRLPEWSLEAGNPYQGTPLTWDWLTKLLGLSPDSSSLFLCANSEVADLELGKGH